MLGVAKGACCMKLVCYALYDNPPAILPASAARDWMDATPQRFAVRCLPLTIANAAGWEILNPVAFSAVWDGGTGLDAVRIEAEGGKPIAVSHFGSGILTFHIAGLFETPQDVQLWAGGSPNRVKDAIQPLTGIIETDWSPYTFTMNWKFTRSGQRVHFAVDEPICFIFPVKLDMLENVEPEIRSINDVPEHAENNRIWRNSRNEFNKELKVPQSDARKKKWQKSYHQGVSPDGTKARSKHRTRLRLKQFARAQRVLE